MASRAARAADIRMCIKCFYCLGKPCGAVGRATAVSCGVCINNSRGCCCGSGTRVVLTMTFVLVAAIVIWMKWDAISETAGGLYNVTSNATVEHESNVIEFSNTTSGFYDSTTDQINQGIEKIGSNPNLVRLDNKTDEIYDNAKDAVGDTFDSIKNDDTGKQVSNGTAGVWEKVKGWKIWG